MTATDFLLLGPLEVWRDGQQLAVRGTKPRALLAMLLLHAGEVVSTDALIDALWGERPPATASNALQAHVAALRRALDPERAGRAAEGVVVTRAPGYVLCLAGAGFDIARFERLAAVGHDTLQADPAAAAAMLREALALWRGPALAEFVYERFARAEASRLEELRLIALEERVQADLALGRHVEVVPELEALRAEHPLRERLAEQLMLALYRSGRQADASRVFQETRAVLVEELGMEPQPPLHRLLQRVLDHDPGLDWPGATGDRAADNAALLRPNHNLPIELTSFVGRERELEEVCSLLRDHRVLTLTGVGGSGKTRLALRAAREVRADYRDGVWLVELAALTDPALVAMSLAAALGVRDRSGALVETLKRTLQASQLLLVLDNCEHLIEACAELAHELLSSCEQVRILATSREPLNIASEVTWPVPGLGLPGPAIVSSPQELERFPAVRLFTERASAARPGFTLDPNNAETVSVLCRRLDGIPLAIELAAARVRVLSASEILRRLDDRFGLLTGGVRDAVARQQTLRATVDWSHELLDRAERALFRRLSVFAGGWTLADAEEVCTGEDLRTETIFDVLSELVAKSLVVADIAAAGSTRYRMLETLRYYAAERLTAAGEMETTRRRHLGHFLRLTEDAHEQQQTSGAGAELKTLLSQHDNLRAALAFAQRTDPTGLLRLAAASEHLWLAGHLSEGRRWLGLALAQDAKATVARQRALYVAGVLTGLQAEHEQARRLLDESLTLASTLGDRTGEARARTWLAFLDLTNDPPETRQSERSLEINEALGDQLGTCRSLAFLGTALAQLPDSKQQGHGTLQRAVELAHEIEDEWGEGFASTFLGWAELELGNRELAATLLRRAVLIEALGPIRGTALDALAKLAVDQYPDRAIRLLAASDALRKRDGGRPPTWILRSAAETRARAEQRLDPADARQAWEEGIALTTENTIAYALDDREPTPPPQQQPGAGSVTAAKLTA